MTDSDNGKPDLRPSPLSTSEISLPISECYVGIGFAVNFFVFLLAMTSAAYLVSNHVVLGYIR